MKSFKQLIISFVCCLFCMNVYAYAAHETVMLKNQRGSILKLTFQTEKDHAGSLTGTFMTAVGDCKADVGKPVPLTGFFNGNAVALTINFPHCKQVVAMTGNLSSNHDALHTLWLDATDVNDPMHRDWNSNNIGTDIYKKIG